MALTRRANERTGAIFGLRFLLPSASSSYVRPPGEPEELEEVFGPLNEPLKFIAPPERERERERERKRERESRMLREITRAVYFSRRFPDNRPDDLSCPRKTAKREETPLTAGRRKRARPRLSSSDSASRRKAENISLAALVRRRIGST